jgi:hypothetical protein
MLYERTEMTAIQNTKKAREARALQAVARQVEREKLSVNEQLDRLDQRPGNSIKEKTKLIRAEGVFEVKRTGTPAWKADEEWLTEALDNIARDLSPEDYRAFLDAHRVELNTYYKTGEVADLRAAIAKLGSK